jgi:hypothetical protein
MDDPDCSRPTDDYSDGDDPVVSPFKPHASHHPEHPITSQKQKDQTDSQDWYTPKRRRRKVKAYWRRFCKAGPDRHIELLIAFIVVIFAALQYANTRSSSQQMNSLIQAATQIEHAGWEFSGAAIGINNAGWDAVGKLNDQATQLANNVKQTGRLASDTENANQNVIESDRPWFGATLTQQDAVEVGKTPSATVVFMNSGKRPAKVTLAEVADHWFDTFPPKPDYPVMPLVSTEMIVPGAEVTNKFNFFKQPLSQIEVDTAQAGKPVKLFLYANIEYVDVKTGESHFTHACWVYIGNDPLVSKGFYNCGEYQDAN